MTLRTVVFLIAALTAVGRAPTPREELKARMRAAPGEPWPRGAGHVVLAWPHSSEPGKAYHEPGGSFSPAVGSFGVQIRVGDITSDTVRLGDVRQRMRWTDGPGIETVTPSYTALWSSPRPGRWILDLDAKGRPAILIRSAGPAGGPVRSLDWNGARLMVNGKWTITAKPTPLDVQISADSSNGWGWAVMQARGPKLRLEIVSEPPGVPPFTPAAFGPRLSVPDKRFEASLQAQVMHLLMGLVNGQTRPGEPTNYPLAWLRDGSYTLTALARAGQLETARRLSRYFAENDFFGGFGAEADGPGLALWALEEPPYA